LLALRYGMFGYEMHWGAKEKAAEQKRLAAFY
jgi:hypothetical protein